MRTVGWVKSLTLHAAENSSASRRLAMFRASQPTGCERTSNPGRKCRSACGQSGRTCVLIAAADPPPLAPGSAWGPDPGKVFQLFGLDVQIFGNATLGVAAVLLFASSLLHRGEPVPALSSCPLRSVFCPPLPYVGLPLLRLAALALRRLAVPFAAARPPAVLLRPQCATSPGLHPTSAAPRSSASRPTYSTAE